MVPVKPSDKEEEYFKRLDEEKKKHLREKLDKKRSEEERKKAKDASWMKCPKCGDDLEEIEHLSVKIDRCTGCGGIWLDKGELEILQGDASFVTSFKKLFR
jgi:ribosomal protein L37AE/L43A